MPTALGRRFGTWLVSRDDDSVTVDSVTVDSVTIDSGVLHDDIGVSHGDEVTASA